MKLIELRSVRKKRVEFFFFFSGLPENSGDVYCQQPVLIANFVVTVKKNMKSRPDSILQVPPSEKDLLSTPL